ncbi:Hypothetical protein SMB2099_2234 [Serratia marcescens SMB2099]|nr:Hypothetical protein SMB2099_2234 [Serratia marcescens SMB2099]
MEWQWRWSPFTVVVTFNTGFFKLKKRGPYYPLKNKADI